MTTQEILKRLQFIQSIRQSYMNDFAIDKNKYGNMFKYNLLPDIEKAEWVKIESDYIDAYDIVYGNYEKELGFINIDKKILLDDCTYEEIKKIEQEMFLSMLDGLNTYVQQQISESEHDKKYYKNL